MDGPTYSTAEAIAELGRRGVAASPGRVKRAHHAHGIGAGGGAQGANLRFSAADVDRLEGLFRPVQETAGMTDVARELGVAKMTVHRAAERLGITGVETDVGRRFAPADVARLRADIRPGQRGRRAVHGDYVGWHERYGKGRRGSTGAGQGGADASGG